MAFIWIGDVVILLLGLRSLLALVVVTPLPPGTDDCVRDGTVAGTGGWVPEGGVTDELMTEAVAACDD